MNTFNIDLNKCSVVTGRSILSSSAKILTPDCKRCTYLEYKTFCDFLECAILYDDIYVLGNLNPRETPALELMSELNRRHGKPFIHMIDDSSDKFFINGENVDKVSKEIIEEIFGKDVSFIRKQLIPESFIYRYTDDEKTAFLEGIVSVKEGKNVYEHIKDQIIGIRRQRVDSEFNKHLFRGIIIASVSSIIAGTAKFTGSRKPLGILIKKNNPKGRHYETYLQNIYNHSNSLYIKRQKSKSIDFYQPLLFSIYLTKRLKKQNALSIIMELRAQFKELRVLYSNLHTDSKAQQNINAEEIVTTKKYFTEVYQFASDNNFFNLGRKYTKELLLDENIVEVKFELEDSDESDNSSTSTSINLIKILKYIIKFSVHYNRFRRIKKRHEPLVSYFVQLINSKMVSPEVMFSIDEFYKSKMKSFDEFLVNHNI